jgi:elongation factor 1-alpha
VCRTSCVGWWLERKKQPSTRSQVFVAQIVVVNHPANKIQQGYTPVVHCHNVIVACTFAEIISKVHRRTGKVIEESPNSLKNGDAAIVKLVPVR